MAIYVCVASSRNNEKHEQCNRNVSEEKTYIVFFAARHCDPVKFINRLSVCVIADACRRYEGVVFTTSIPNHHLTCKYK